MNIINEARNDELQSTLITDLGCHFQVKLG